MIDVKRWEYMNERVVGGMNVADYIAEYGRDGWELVSVCAFSDACVAYLKRPLQEAPAEPAK